MSGRRRYGVGMQSTHRPTPRTHLHLLARHAVAALLLAALAACGGGEAQDEAEGTKTLQPVDCKAKPKACI
jgi:hypothetical protein